MIFAHLIQAASSLPTDVSALESSLPALESEIKTLESSSIPWEHLLPWVTAVVVVGIAMELWMIWHERRDDMEAWALAYFLGKPRLPGRPSTAKFVIEAASVLLVILGIVGELGVGIKIASINGKLRNMNAELRSKSDQLVAVLGDEAAKATATAEHEKLEQDQLELLVSPRRLTLDQQKGIGKVCAGINRGPVEVGSYGMDSEGRALANQIAYAIFDHTFPVKLDQGGPVTSGALDEGVLINGPETAKRFMDCLANALVNIGRLKEIKINGERHAGTSIMGGATIGGNASISGGATTVPAGPLPAGSPIRILVGVKPIELLILKK